MPLARYEIKLFDQFKAPIPEEYLPVLIVQFKNCSNFYIEFVVTATDGLETPQQYDEVRVF